MKAISYLRTVSRTRRRRLDRPRLLTYTVTFGCNARCVMCDSWRKPTDDDLRLWEIERILRQLPRLDAVRLTGGEPFVRQDLVEIARLVDRHLRPMVLHVTTNGFLTRRIVDFCERRPTRTPLHLLVSIDGVGRKHDEIRGNATAYRSAMRTIEDLAPRRKELRISLAVNQTIVDATGLEHYRLLREALRPFGVRNHVVMAYDRSATYAVDREVDLAPDEPGGFTTFGAFTRGQLAELLDEVERDLPGLPVFERLAKRYYLRGIRNRLLGGRGAPNPPCVALNAHLRIFPDGTVPTCQFNTKPIGNLREQPFDAVWNGVLARTQREWVAACPGCWAECEALPSAVYTGDLLGEVWRGDRRAVGESARASWLGDGRDDMRQPGSGRAPIRFRTVWISDVHLGTRSCKAHFLLDFLESIRADHLFLVGDVLDLWKARSGWVWTEAQSHVVRRILRMSELGTRVVYVPGNHDETFRELAGGSLGPVEVQLRASHRLADGRRFLVMHGDEFDAIVCHHRWLAILGGRLYDWTVTLNTVFNWGRRQLGYGYWSLSACLKMKAKQATKLVADFEHAVTEHARAHGYDGVVCGHIHKAEIKDIDGVLYCNDGDWVESCTALVEEFDGSLRILHWADRTVDAIHGAAAPTPELVS